MRCYSSSIISETNKRTNSEHECSTYEYLMTCVLAHFLFFLIFKLVNCAKTFFHFYSGEWKIFKEWNTVSVHRAFKAHSTAAANYENTIKIKDWTQKKLSALANRIWVQMTIVSIIKTLQKSFINLFYPLDHKSDRQMRSEEKKGVDRRRGILFTNLFTGHLNFKISWYLILLFIFMSIIPLPTCRMHLRNKNLVGRLHCCDV